MRPRIVGGKNVKGFHYSWYGILVDPDDYAPFCGANLISHKVSRIKMISTNLCSF